MWFSRGGLRKTTHLQEQFDNLILKPMEDLTETVGPVLIVIDALDESGDPESREILLRVLTSRLSKLPSHFRILITTRPEKDVQDNFKNLPSVYQKAMSSIQLKSTCHDISVYIHQELDGLSGLEKQWPGDAWCEILTEKSEGLFQWAFTACRLIKGVGRARMPPVEQLKEILSSKNSTLSSLDNLYQTVLKQNVDHDDPKAMAQFQLIMGRILAAKEPLSMMTWNLLRCSDDPGDLCWTIRYLGAILSGVIDADTHVHPLHMSFHDFLLDPKRSGHFHIDIEVGHVSLAQACLQTMTRMLKFNICNLPTSYHCNDNIPGITMLICNGIPTYLAYSCQFWPDHLESASVNSIFLTEVENLMSCQFLYWLEVLSLIKKLYVASPGMINRVCHGYTAGTIFPHRTRPRRNRPLPGFGYIPTPLAVYRKPAYTYYPRLFFMYY